eukprot:gene27376-33066_t
MKQWIATSQSSAAGSRTPSSSAANEWAKRTHSSVEEHIDLHPAVKKKRVLPPSVQNLSNPVRQKPFQLYNSHDHGGRGMKSFKSVDSEVIDLSDNLPAGAAPDSSTNPINIEKEYSLSSSQKQVLDAIARGHSVFFTGAAGTGKSYILSILQEVGKVAGISDNISLTAPTGIAACNIGGLTLHSWAGIGQGSEPIEPLIGIVQRNKQAKQRWQETKILVIDEVSMLSAELFDKLDIIARRIRNCLKPFGGLQLVLCGDFFQLPPVGLGKGTSFCFASQAWQELFPQNTHTYILHKVYRQREDNMFLSLLQELRIGEVSAHTQQILHKKVQESHQNTMEKGDMVKPTKLFSTNKDVEAYNHAELRNLLCSAEKSPGGDLDGMGPNGERYFKCIDEGQGRYLDQLKSGIRAPEMLCLARGAQVMLLKNLAPADGLVNGARGIVLGFENAFYPYLPVVKFEVTVTGVDGEGGKSRREEIRTLTHEVWEVKQGDKILASRIQLPLMLAWGLSIHKAQGLTIPYLEVTFQGMFEFGQAYVALSRAVSLEGLRLTSFSGNAVRAHPQVKEFHKAMLASQAGGASAAEGEVSVSVGHFLALYRREGQERSKERGFTDNDQWIEAKRQPNGNTSNVTGKAKVEDLWLLDDKHAPKSQFRKANTFEEYKAADAKKPFSLGFTPVSASNSNGGRDVANAYTHTFNPPSQTPIAINSHLSQVAHVTPSPSHSNNHQYTHPFNLTNSTPSPSLSVSSTNINTNTNGSGNSTSTNVTTGTHGNTSSRTATGGMSEEVKRRIEENRQLALQKLEQYKKRRMEEENAKR